MAEENGSGGPGAAVWAIALIAIVAIIIAVLFSGRIFNSGHKEIDVDIKPPTVSR
jgi:hypothetical protein